MHHLEPEDLAAHKAMCAYLLELVANVNLIENCCSVMKLLFIPVEVSIETTAEFGQTSNLTE